MKVNYWDHELGDNGGACRWRFGKIKGSDLMLRFEYNGQKSREGSGRCGITIRLVPVNDWAHFGYGAEIIVSRSQGFWATGGKGDEIEVTHSSGRIDPTGCEQVKAFEVACKIAQALETAELGENHIKGVPTMRQLGLEDVTDDIKASWD